MLDSRADSHCSSAAGLHLWWVADLDTSRALVGKVSLYSTLETWFSLGGSLSVGASVVVLLRGLETGFFLGGSLKIGALVLSCIPRKALIC